MTEAQAAYTTSETHKLPLLQYWLDSTTKTPKTFGIDVSKWQGSIDYHQCYRDGVKFAAIRCTVGDYYTDERFLENWIGFKEADILRAPYMVVAPAWSAYYGYKPVTAQAHMELFNNTFDGMELELPIVLDCELSRNQTPEYIADLIADLCWMIDNQYGRLPIIYTRGNWWNENTVSKTVFGLCDLWIARYNTAISHPWEDRDIFKPRDWDDWKFWQWSEEYQIDGIPNANVDADWFNGTLEDLLEYAEQETPEPEPDPELEERVEALEQGFLLLTSQFKQFKGETEANLGDHEERITALETHEQKDTVTATVTGDKAVAFKVSGFNNAGKPIMVKHEPVVRYDTGERFEVYPERIDADGSLDYHLMRQMAGETLLYCRADKIRI